MARDDDEDLEDAILAGICSDEHEDACSYPSCKCPASMWVDYRRQAKAALAGLRTAGFTVST